MQIIAIIVKTTLKMMIMMHIHWIHINRVTMMVINHVVITCIGGLLMIMMVTCIGGLSPFEEKLVLNVFSFASCCRVSTA